MNTFIVIPARAGSRRLRGKNLHAVAGMSLVARAVFAARSFVAGASIRARVFIDTDSSDIAAEAARWGAEVPGLRPASLATDDTSSVDSTLALLDRLGARDDDAVILLQPTSPLRTDDDIAACWSRFVETGRPIASVSDDPVHAAAIVGAQIPLTDAAGGAALHRLNGAVYITTVGSLRVHRRFVLPDATDWLPMPALRSIDVDTAADLAQAEALATAARPPGIRIAGRQVGGGAPCFVIAEAGVNHNGRIELARELVDIAADAGADAVKFQTFDPDALAAPAAPTAEYQRRNTGDADQKAMLRALTLPPEAFAELAERAASRGIMFLSTAFDEVSARLLVELGVPALKIPSGEVTNIPFIEFLASQTLPLLISTGMCDMSEVGEAVLAVRRAGAPPLCLFHCVSDYPTPPADCNLPAMAMMRSAFDVPVGWSDHTEGIDISLAAVAAGAEVLEKHFTADRTLPGPDHAASLEPRELRRFITATRDIEAALTGRPKGPTPAELATAAVVRRSLHVARDLPAGHVLSVGDITTLRPGTGLRPTALGAVAGRVLRRDLRRFDMLREDDIVT